MSEEDYIKATNLAKIRTVQAIMRDMMCGDDYGICPNDWYFVSEKLTVMAERADKSFEIEL